MTLYATQYTRITGANLRELGGDKASEFNWHFIHHVYTSVFANVALKDVQKAFDETETRCQYESGVDWLKAALTSKLEEWTNWDIKELLDDQLAACS